MSDFGKGFAYCLGLFLAHAEREFPSGGDYNYWNLWFDGAYDHLYELETSPEMLGKKLSADVVEFREFCYWMKTNESATQKDVEKAVDWAKRILLAWDIKMGIRAEGANWK